MDYFILVQPQAFNSEYYHEAFVQIKGAAELLCYEEEYENLMDEASSKLDGAFETLAQRRYEELSELYAQYEQILAVNPEAAAQLGEISPPQMPEWYALGRSSLAGYVGLSLIHI